jgi:hypothetical protein
MKTTAAAVASEKARISGKVAAEIADAREILANKRAALRAEGNEEGALALSYAIGLLDAKGARLAREI